MNERRKDKRAPVDLPITIKVGKRPLAGSTVNVSFHGLCVKVDETPPLRQLVHIDVNLPTGKAFTAQIILIHQFCRAGMLQRTCVVPLVIVCGRRQRNENRRAAGRSHFCERCGSCAGDNKAGGFHLPVHRIDELFHTTGHVVLLERRLNHGEVAHAGLTDELDGLGCSGQPRRRLHDGHIDGVRPLRAAKD